MANPAQLDLWTLALNRQEIGPTELAEALQRQAAQPPLDFRTRLLIRDSLDALQKIWGEQRLIRWLAQSPSRDALQDIWRTSLGSPGFSLLHNRIMEPTRTDNVLQFLRELGQSLAASASINIGGAVALILADLLSRRTEDIDVVDEIPVQIRSEHALLDGLARRYGLRLTHFQSHYLPSGWESRLRPLNTFGRLDVRLVDATDIFVGKLFSKREKDRDDLRALAVRIGKPDIISRLQASAASFMRDSALREQAEKNWYVLHGEALPQ
jgi:hypothetical protein